MRRLFHPMALALPLLAIVSAPGRSQTLSIQVEAGELDRLQTPVRAALNLPEPIAQGDVVRLTAEDGSTLVGQLTGPSLLAEAGRDGSGGGAVVRELHFVLPELAAGASARFELSAEEGDADESGFEWEAEDEGDRLTFGGEPVAFYVRPELDESSPEAREQSYKPFHHLFARDGRRVSKGPGGLFTHHRGLFFGFNRVSYGEGMAKQADVWHAQGKAFQSHEETVGQEAGPVVGRHAVRIDWHGQEGEVFARETREVTAYAPEGGLVFDFASRVETAGGPVRLDGDPQHAGVHFRADNHVAEVSKDQTVYLRPDGPGKPGATRNWEPKTGEGPVNLPWNAMIFEIDGDRYSVAYLDHPENPKEARYSERDYGRFGSYFEYDITEDRPLEIRYRLWLQEGELGLDRAVALDADFDDPVRVRIAD